MKESTYCMQGLLQECQLDFNLKAQKKTDKRLQ